MSTGIPLPGSMLDALMKGVNTGSSLYSGIMQPILEREKQKQLENHFQEQLKLSKAAAGRNAQLFPYRLQELRDKHAASQFERNMMNQLLGGGQEAGGEGGTQEGSQNPLMATLMKNPMMRGWFKHKFGYDPLAPVAQTPQEKQNMALDLFKQKEAIKDAKKSGNTATNKVLTQNQQAVQAIDTVVPMIDEFIKKPHLVYGQLDFNPSKKAAYEAKTGGMIDMLVAAQSLPQVKESVKLVEDQIRRHTGESTDAYIKRLKDFKKDLMARRGKSAAVVNSKKVDTTQSNDFSNMSDDELRRIAGGG